MAEISDIGDLERAVAEKRVPQVDVFSLVSVIGKGDYCIAFRAHAGDNPTWLHYAVLFPLKPEYHRRVKNKGRLLQVYKKNPHQTRFICEGMYRGMPFLVESYARPLTQVLELARTGFRANTEEFAGFMDDLLGALDFYHAQGYVLDLHPGNLGIDSSKVKLLDIDFASSGLAQSAGISGQKAQTGISNFDNTYLYAAPEVCAGEAPTPSSNIYSAGALGFALLIGCPPQRWEHDVHALRPELPRWTSSLLASMVQQNERRPSAYDVQKWLQGYLEHDEVHWR